MKVFDVIGYLQERQTKGQMYMQYVLGQVQEKNPEWINTLKKDQDLFDADGNALDPSKEVIEAKVKSILEQEGFTSIEVDLDMVHEMFVVTKEDVNKFMI